MSNVDSWCKACGEVDLPSELQDLEDAIHHHQGIYEHITLAYSEVRMGFTSSQGIGVSVIALRLQTWKLWAAQEKLCVLLNCSHPAFGFLVGRV